MFETYKPSGGFGILIVPAILIGAAIAIGTAFVYQFLLNWIPIIYVNLLLTLGAGFLLSIIGAFICRVGHSRNRAIGLMVGVLLATSFLGAKFWFQYQSSIPATREAVMAEFRAMEFEEPMTGEQLEGLVNTFMTDSYSFIDHLTIRVKEGWQIGRRGGGGPVAGIFVYLIWLIEAGVVYFLAVTGSLAQSGSPYSEKMSTWANEEELVMTLPVSDAEMVVQIKQATTIDQLLEIPIPKTDQSNQFAIYKTSSIPGAELEDAYLTVELLELSVNNKGEQVKKETPLVTHAILTSEKRKELVENASLLQEALADYRDAVNEEIDEEADGAEDAEV